MSLILVRKNDFNIFFFFVVCLRQFRESFYATFYQSFSCTSVFSALSWGIISPWLHELQRICRNCFQVNCLSLKNCMILKSADVELSQQRKNISSYLILTYNGNQASSKREQLFFLHITR